MSDAAISAEVLDTIYLEAREALLVANTERDHRMAMLSMRRAARAGHPYAHYEMGLYEMQLGAPEDINLEEAVRWFQAAASRHVPEASSELARLHLYRGDKRFPREAAIPHLIAGAELECPDAALEIGKCLLLTHRNDESLQHAKDWLEKSAHLGHPSAYRWLGYMAWRGLPVLVELDKAVALTTKAANGGDVAARFQLALLGMDDFGERDLHSPWNKDDVVIELSCALQLEDQLLKDGEISLEQFAIDHLDGVFRLIEDDFPREVLLAAAAGHLPAISHVGENMIVESGLFDEPKGSKPSEDETTKALFDYGKRLVAHSAERGYPRAQWIMGEWYSRRSKTMDDALRLLSAAGRQGHKASQTLVEKLFETSCKNASEISRNVFLAEAGVVHAQFELATTYHIDGKAKLAFDWMLAAARGGHREAQKRLAFFYELGEGCAKDRT